MYSSSAIALILAVVFLVMTYRVMFPSKNHFPGEGRTVVITGSSQGAGRGLARVFAQKGANVVLVARNIDKLEKALQYISAAAMNPEKQRFHFISADATVWEENVRIIDEVTKWNNGRAPDIVWANAGGSIPKLFMETTLEEQRAQMDLNYWSAAYLARATLQSWLKPAGPEPKLSDDAGAAPPNRHFIMTCTVAALCGVAGYSVYSAPKAAMRNLADALRSEMNLYNGARRRNPSEGPAADIKIHTLLAGTVLSPGYEKENALKHPVTKVLEEGDPAQTEDEIATIAFRELEKGHQHITTQWLAAAMRVSSLGGTPRNSWFLDTVFSWIVNLAWLFLQPDMDRKVFKYGKQHGMPRA